MQVDGSGVIMMCWITLPGREILPPFPILATVEACHEAQVRKRRATFWPTFLHPLVPVSGPNLQGTLLSQEMQCWFVISHLLSVSFLPLERVTGDDEGGALSPWPESGMSLL